MWIDPSPPPWGKFCDTGLKSYPPPSTDAHRRMAYLLPRPFALLQIGLRPRHKAPSSDGASFFCPTACPAGSATFDGIGACAQRMAWFPHSRLCRLRSRQIHGFKRSRPSSSLAASRRSSAPADDPKAPPLPSGGAFLFCAEAAIRRSARSARRAPRPARRSAHLPGRPATLRRSPASRHSTHPAP